jgi:multicomponent Na+:H+ antiporter subunit B
LKLFMLAFLAGLVALLIWASVDLPDRADHNAPANQHLSPELTEMTESEVVIPNLVSAILADFRSYDTLGETFVIFTAGLAVVLVLQRSRRVREEESGDE